MCMNSDNKEKDDLCCSDLPDLNERFCVGITGHRPNRLDNADISLLHKSVGRILSVIDDVLKNEIKVLFPTLVSPLAEGADRIAAMEALELGFFLYSPLPFPPEEYARDFIEDSSKEIFYELLNEADFVHVLCKDTGVHEREYAYMKAGMEVIRASDLLIAVWDGHGEHGEGGTGQIVNNALAEGVPAVWINSEADHAVKVLLPEKPVTNNILQKILQIVSDEADTGS